MHWSSEDGVSLDVLAPSMPFLVDTGDDINCEPTDAEQSRSPILVLAIPG